MSNYNMIHENQVEMVELSDEAMEAVAGGGDATVDDLGDIKDSVVAIAVDIKQFQSDFDLISDSKF